eukprot:2035045-Prorocentrum_lima.AAC.1
MPERIPSKTPRSSGEAKAEHRSSTHSKSQPQALGWDIRRVDIANAFPCLSGCLRRAGTAFAVAEG